MSLFSWFTRKSAAPKTPPMGDPVGLSNSDVTVPLVPGRHGRPLVAALPPDHAANRKNERMERRELLYTVVRDAMVRAGVLSASYKFKVLSLDQRGRHFLVMMDLAREYGGETTRMSEIEALIAQTAKSRFDVLVSAVYWRINDHVAVGIPQKMAPAPAAATAVLAAAAQPSHAVPASSGPAPAVSAPRATPAAVAAASVAGPASHPVRGTSAAPGPAGAPAPGQRFEPIEADEVAAFRRALAQAAGASHAPAASVRRGVQVSSGSLLLSTRPTGFEDTEMPDPSAPAPDLSNTQYGELR